MIPNLCIAAGLVAAVLASCARTPTPSSATGQPVSRFRTGQVWTFKTPATQPNARLTILRVEDGGKLGTIIRIALSGISYGNGQTHIDHLPFAESAIEASVTKLERESGPLPEFAEGYQEWRRAYDAGHAGVFTISVAEAFTLATDSARKAK